jgi:hypothetical protein
LPLDCVGDVRTRLTSGISWGEQDAIDSIMLGAASVEGFINEIAASVSQRAGDPRDTVPTRLATMAAAVLTAEANRGQIDGKIEAAMTALSSLGTFRQTTPEYQEMKVLFRARNGLLHLKLDARELGQPDRRKGLPSVVRDLKVRKLTGIHPSEVTGAVDALWPGRTDVAPPATVPQRLDGVPALGTPQSFDVSVHPGDSLAQIF